MKAILIFAANATNTGGSSIHGAVEGQSVPHDPIEAALAFALTEAAKAGRFDVVAQLATELQARRTTGSNVVAIDAKAKRGRR